MSTVTLSVARRRNRRIARASRAPGTHGMARTARAGGTPATARTARSRARPKALRWSQLTSRLADVLAAMAEEQYLVVSTKKGNRYVQFVRHAGERGEVVIRAECVGNAYLAGSERLTKRQLAMLDGMGWKAPTHGKDDPEVAGGSVNFHRDFTAPLDFALIARVATATLCDVLRVARPAELQYRSFQEPGGVDVTLPTLGVDKEPLPKAEEGFEEARAAVLAAVRKASRQPDVDYDEDGDIRVKFGKALLLVHVFDSPRFARVFSVMAADVVATEPLLRRLNELNVRAKMVRFLHANGRVWASMDVFAHPLLPKHVISACHVVGEAANELRESLTAEFGKRLALAPAPVQELKN